MKKKSILFLFLIAFGFGLEAQDFKKIQRIEMETLEDYQQRNEEALECAEYILSNPIKESKEQLICLQFIMLWMEGTEIMFVIDVAKIYGYTEKNKGLLGIYLASLVKAALLDEEVAKDSDKIQLAAEELYLDYCENKKNKVKKNKALKKALKERKE